MAIETLGRGMTDRDMDKMMDEHVRRMGEPEPYASLRRQLERLEDEQRRQFAAQVYDSEAEQLRKKIRDLGGEPCA